MISDGLMVYISNVMYITVSVFVGVDNFDTIICYGLFDTLTYDT